jgi:DNA (cytosine-5)-methyltransferase 1
MTAEPISIIAGDCRAKLALIPDRSVALTVTSPPYPGMGMFDGDKMDLWINLGYLIEAHGGRLPLAYVVWPIARDLGLYLQQEVVWVKPARGYPASQRFTSRSERWLWFTKSPKGYTVDIDAVRDPALNRSRDPRNNPAGANPSDVWEFAQVTGSANDRTDHPCPFPTKMIERIILACSASGDTVLDPFGGSGTTAFAALKHGRRPICIEREADYVAETANRVIDWQAAEIARLKAELAKAAQPVQSANDEPDIAEIVMRSRTYREAIAALGWGTYSTTKINRLRRVADAQGLDISHFTGKGWRRSSDASAAVTRPSRAPLRVLDLFSGVGGFSLGLEQHGGFATQAFCEIEPHCRDVLKRHWPKARIHTDIRDLHIKPGEFDVLTGGFPCQDISVIGKRKGLDGEKSGLWNEFERLIEEGRPRFVVIENSEALRRHGLGIILARIDALGYDAEWHCIPASAVGAPHRRDRLWLLAYAKGLGNGCDAAGAPLQHYVRFRDGMAAAGLGEFRGNWKTEPDLARMADGLSPRLDAKRRRALGNSVVPQIVRDLIAPAILEIEARLQSEARRAA